MDPYLWLENLSDPNVIEWINSENKRTREFLRELSLVYFKKLEKYYSYPNIRLARVTEKGYFILVREKKSQKIVLLSRSGKSVKLVDSDKLGENIVLTYFYVNSKGTRLAYSYSIKGSDEMVLRVLDTSSLKILDEVKGSVGNVVWIDENKYYYVRTYRREKAPDGVEPPTSRVFLRENGSEKLVFGEKLPTAHFISLHMSTDNKHILVTVSYGWSQAVLHGGKLDDYTTWTKIYDEKCLAKPVDCIKEGYFIISYSGEGYGTLIKVDESGEKEVVVEENKYPLENAAVVGEKILVHYLRNASSSIKLYTIEGEPLNEVSFYPPGWIYSMNSNRIQLVFCYTSFTVPYRLYVYRPKEGLKILDSKVLDGKYIVEEDYAESYDGTKVHFFILRKKNYLKKAIVYGYGGFGISLVPAYSPHIMPFIDEGGVYVIANIRGGREYGEKWHKAGMKENKQNVFEDFKAVLKYFKEKGYRVAAIGSSNGGLLVATILTQSPELVDCAIIGYPLTDMLRFHKLYIGKAWVPEYGNPENPEDLKYLAAYSPYHNVKKRKYPPVLIYTGLHDDRVHPGHALKFAAKLKEVGAPVYLRVETCSGHAGAAPVVKQREQADILAFIHKVLSSEVSWAK